MEKANNANYIALYLIKKNLYILTPPNADSGFMYNALRGRKYTWSPGFSQVTATVEAPLFWVYPPDHVVVSFCEFL